MDELVYELLKRIIFFLIKEVLDESLKKKLRRKTVVVHKIKFDLIFNLNSTSKRCCVKRLKMYEKQIQWLAIMYRKKQ